MKRRELLKLFAKAGWYLKRNGSQHDIYTNGVDSEAVPRHPDINERLVDECKGIRELDCETDKSNRCESRT